MTRILLCKSKREFTLWVESQGSMRTINFDRLNLFIDKDKTGILEKRNYPIVELINETHYTLRIPFKTDADSNFICGKITN